MYRRVLSVGFLALALCVGIFFAGPVWSYEVTWEELPTLGSTLVTCVNDTGQIAGTSAGGGFLWDADTGMIDLGPMPEGLTFIDLGCLNNSGKIYGRGEADTGQHVILWQEGVGWTDLGSLGGSFIVPSSINDAGQIVGYGETATGEIHAFLWQVDTGMIEFMGGLESNAGHINNAGQILGGYVTTSGEGHPFLWEKGKITDLGITSNKAVGLVFFAGINDSGQIAGTSQEYHAILWKKGKTTDLGTLGGSFSVATHINDAGQIVGYGETATGEIHVFLAETGKKSTSTMTDLGSLGGYIVPISLNNKGQVAGYAQTASGVETVFFWQEGLGMIDLDPTNHLGWPMWGTYMLMNEDGQVVVNVNMGGNLRAFIFTIHP